MVRVQKHKPSFFKFMHGDFAHHMRIPPAFVKHFNGVPSQQVLLKVSTGKRWVVNLKKAENELFFERGWGGFREDNSLEFGDLLTFTLLADSMFYVKIYDKSCCEKKKKNTSCTSSPKQKNLKAKSVGKKMVFQQIKTYQQAFQSKSPHPFFIIKLRPTSLQRSFLTIPISFVRTYLPKQAKSARILDSDGRTWPVNYTYPSKAYLCGGWSKFVSENKLKERHFCAFELIGLQEDITLKFSVLNA